MCIHSTGPLVLYVYVPGKLEPRVFRFDTVHYFETVKKAVRTRPQKHLSENLARFHLTVYLGQQAVRALPESS